MKIFIKISVLATFLFNEVRLNSQDLDHCTTPWEPFIQTRSNVPHANVYKLKDKAIIAEYPSVFDVHNKPDTVKYPNIRIQPVSFDAQTVLRDVKPFVKADQIDFALFFFLQEVPGWINSGPRLLFLAQNIGLGNSLSVTPISGWPKLRSIPHMNDVEFLNRPTSKLPNYGSTLTVFHEIGHYVSMYFCQQSTGPTGWNNTKPLGHLAGASSHWSWNYIPSNNIEWPGIMYSGPTHNTFNAFDLYSFGLYTYDEAIKHTYTIYENLQINKTHTLKLDDLIHSLSLVGGSSYTAPGKRIPASSPEMKNINVVTIIVKGQNEIMTKNDSSYVINLVDQLPKDWNIATWGRSQMASNLALNNAISSVTAINSDFDPSIKMNWNSTDDELYIETPIKYNAKKLRLELYDVSGRSISSYRLQSEQEWIKTPFLPSGIIVAVIRNEYSKIIQSKKFMNL